MTKTWVPEVPEERIRELAKRIRPVFNFGPGVFRGGLRYIEPVDLFGIAYTWDPEPAGKASGLVLLRDIRTYHSYGYYGLFKPNIAEVIAQVPEEDLEEAVAFEIIEHPELASDLSKDEESKEALDAGYHVAKTRLYKRDR
jgi:hypothetical protein